MGIQIFGKSKCFDTKKAQRFFSERGVKVQYVDLSQRPMSRGELTSVVKAVGGVDAVIDEKSKRYCEIKYLLEDARFEKLLEEPMLLKTPIVRNAPAAVVGGTPESWAELLK